MVGKFEQDMKLIFNEFMQKAGDAIELEAGRSCEGLELRLEGEEFRRLEDLHLDLRRANIEVERRNYALERAADIAKDRCAELEQENRRLVEQVNGLKEVIAESQRNKL